MEERDWAAQTRSYLASTLPLDTGKAIMFLPEQGTSKQLTTENNTDSLPSKQLSTLTGKEAKDFYEEVLSMPKEHKVVKSKRKLKPSRIKRNSIRQQRRVLEQIPRIGEVFRFAQDGELESLKSVISQRQYDVNMTDTFDWTLLMSAAYAGHIETVKYLMSVGAEWRETINSSGQNAVDLALSAGHNHIADLIKHYNDEKYIPSSNSRDLNSHISYLDPNDNDSQFNIQNTPEKREPYFCDICKLSVSQEAPHKHSTSTLHQFNCQHHPSPHVVYGIPQSNRGYQMLLKKGWDPESGLGSEQQGQQFPVKTVLKRDRLGLGVQSKDKARVTHFEAGDTAAIRRPGDSVETKQLKKKEILREARKDKQWELKMRQYLSTDSDY